MCAVILILMLSAHASARQLRYDSTSKLADLRSVLEIPMLMVIH